jgi:hypothetical protein
MTIRERSSQELTPEQKQNTRRLLFLMDLGLQLPSFDDRPDAGPLIPSIDQLCEAYQDAGVTGFKKAIKTLSIDQPILGTLYQAVKKYRPLTVREVLDMPEQEWIVTNFLYEDALSFVYGPPGCGKSFLALDWACHLALGIDWLGHKVKRCRVIYVATEGVRGYRRRIQAWCAHHKHPPEELLQTITFIPCAVPLGNSAEVDDFISMQLMALEGHSDGLPTMVILDTVFQCAAGLNINQTEVATQIISTAQHIRKELNATHVMLIHHSGKDKERGMSGNMAMKAGADLSYQVEKDRDGEIKVIADKIKDDEPTTTYLRLEKVTYDIGERDHSCVIVISDPPVTAEQLVLIEKQMLQALPTQGPGLTFTAWVKAASIPKSTFARYRDALIEKGLVRKAGSDNKPLYVRIEQEAEREGDDGTND